MKKNEIKTVGRSKVIKPTITKVKFDFEVAETVLEETSSQKLFNHLQKEYYK
jgi:hypothetical protein